MRDLACRRTNGRWFWAWREGDFVITQEIVNPAGRSTGRIALCTTQTPAQVLGPNR